MKHQWEVYPSAAEVNWLPVGNIQRQSGTIIEIYSPLCLFLFFITSLSLSPLHFFLPFLPLSASPSERHVSQSAASLLLLSDILSMHCSNITIRPLPPPRSKHSVTHFHTLKRAKVRTSLLTRCAVFFLFGWDREEEGKRPRGWKEKDDRGREGGNCENVKKRRDERYIKKREREKRKSWIGER